MNGPSTHAGEEDRGPADSPSPVRLERYWALALERRAVVFSSLALVLGATLVGVSLTTPLYRASTTIEVSPNAPDILTFKDIVRVDNSLGARSDFFETQYRIMESHVVARMAAEQIDLPRRPEYAGRKPAAVARLRGWLSSQLRSSATEAPTEEVSPLDRATAFIQGSLDVAPVRNSQLVEISFTDRDPILAADIANAASAAYQQFTFDARYDTTGKAKEFLAKDVARVQAEIVQLERNLQDLSEKKEILSIGDGTEDIRERSLADLSRRHTQALGELSAAEARFRAVENAAPDAIEEVLNSLTIGHLRREQAVLERRLRQMRERFDESWPALVEVRQEFETATLQLHDEAERIAAQVRAVAGAEFDRLQDEVANLARETEGLKRDVQRAQRDGIEYAGFRQEIDTKRKVLADLVARQSETETSFRLKDTRASSVRTVDRAEVPARPFSPSKTRSLALALIVGLGVGVGMAFLFDHLDNTVKGEQDVERIAGLSVLGRVPLTHDLRAVDDSDKDRTASLDLASHLDPRGAVSEAFRELRTSILLATPDHPPRHVVVTSCEPQEGKSTVAINLATVLTQAGRRVLVVDADLRRPRVHKTLGVANGSGLSSYLSGNATLDGLVLPTRIPGLSVVPSGPIPPNPSELLGSPGLGTLVRFFEDDERFDHIIFDSPPVLSVTDAIVLSTCLDSTVLVTRSAVTTREALSAVMTRLRRARANVIGAVLNAASFEHGYYGRHSYGYLSSESAAAADTVSREGGESATRRRAG